MKTPAAVESATTYEVQSVRLDLRRDGALAGTPMAEIRLARWKRNPDPAKVMDAKCVAELARLTAGTAVDWAFLYGDEPFDHDLDDLADALSDEGFSIAAQSRGTGDGYRGACFGWLTIVPNLRPGTRRPTIDALEAADEVRFTIGDESDAAAYRAMLDPLEKLPDCITATPADRTSLRHIALCVRVCKERGWRLSLPLAGI